MNWAAAKVHFIGIGGSGMSGIARILVARGAMVSGSDLHDSPALDSLRNLGVKIYIGHAETNVAGAEVVVRSSAIPDTNPEIQRAKADGIEVLGRAEALAQLMIGKKSIAVAGTHGKTTTTSMLTVALQHCHLDPSFAIGATVRNSGTNAHHGSGDIFVVEADESDGSFMNYRPDGALITNIELDHVDNYKDLASIDALFDKFVETIGKTLVVCSDDRGIQRLLTRINETTRARIKIQTYGFEGDPDLLIDRVVLNPKNSIARLTVRGRVLGEMKLSVPGRHNLLNAAGALLMASEFGANLNDAMHGLGSFTGARRRFEVKGVVGGVTVIDDYGHHPTEIRATLETARTFAGNGRIITIFQPHRFSRTQAFAAEFASELAKSDHTYLLEVYSAGEAPITGATSTSIATRMGANVTFEPSMPAVIEHVVADAKAGDVILTLGAGDVSSLGPLILENLQER
jgi:UDP-N-acetylmuramate--alanine ligase